MMPDKSIIINYRIERSRETIKDAKIAMDNNSLFMASNRIYYAIFYIVSALASKYEFVTSKHKQLMGWFNHNFINTSIFDKKFKEFYREAFENRQESDYADMIQLKFDEVQTLFDDMLLFVNEIERFIKES
jgi:uncharacterized protein (UPF0332 family)